MKPPVYIMSRYLCTLTYIRNLTKSPRQRFGSIGSLVFDFYQGDLEYLLHSGGHFRLIYCGNVQIACDTVNRNSLLRVFPH